MLMNKRAEGSWWGGLFSLYANNSTSPLSNYRFGSASTEAFVLSVRPSPLVYRCELGTARSWRWSWYFISTYIKLGMLEWHLTRHLSGRNMTIKSPSMCSRAHSTWNCSCDVLLHALLPMLVCVLRSITASCGVLRMENWPTPRFFCHSMTKGRGIIGCLAVTALQQSGRAPYPGLRRSV